MELRKRYRVQVPEEDYPALASMAEHGEVPRAADEGREEVKAEGGRPGCSRMSKTADTALRPGLISRLSLIPNPQSLIPFPCTTPLSSGRACRAGGGDPPGPLRPAGLHPRASHAVGGLNSFSGRRGRTYDVGLHAVTNYTPQGTRQGPLARLLRQLRLAWDEFSLVAAGGLGDHVSAARRWSFPTTSGCWNRGGAALSRGSGQFPPAWWRELTDYDRCRPPEAGQSAREVVGSLIGDPLLVEMLFCPVFFYGGAREHDMDFGQFCILFRSIFLEGLARPLAGVRLILKRLLAEVLRPGGRAAAAGRRGADRWSRTAGPIGSCWTTAASSSARNVLSSAGLPETMRLCDERGRRAAAAPTGCRSSSRSRS